MRTPAGQLPCAIALSVVGLLLAPAAAWAKQAPSPPQDEAWSYFDTIQRSAEELVRKNPPEVARELWRKYAERLRGKAVKNWMGPVSEVEQKGQTYTMWLSVDAAVRTPAPGKPGADAAPPGRGPSIELTGLSPMDVATLLVGDEISARGVVQRVYMDADVVVTLAQVSLQGSGSGPKDGAPADPRVC